MVRVHSRETRVYIEQFDVSGRGVALETNSARTLPETSAFGDSGRTYLGVAIREDKWTMEVIFDDSEDTNGTDAAFRDLRTSTARVVTLWNGGDSRGRSGLGGGANIGSVYTVSSRVTEVVMGNAEVDFNGPAERIISLGVRHRTNITGNENTTSVDNNTLHAGSTSPTTNGGALYFNVFTHTSSGGGWIAQLQHSTNNSAFVAVVSSPTFVDTTGGRVGFTTQLQRFVRGLWAIQGGSSGTLQGHMSYFRG